jgi:uncharacterized oxidoreductase
MTRTADVVVPAGRLRAFAAGVLEGMGAHSDAAAEVARHLVDANLAGHDSHGVLRLPQYVLQMDNGRLDPAAQPAMLKESASLALFDARRGLGQWSTRCALEWCAEQAAREGIAGAAVRHSTHAGRLGDYAERACERGLVAILCLGVAGPGAGLVAPFNGSSRYLGTNPWAIGIPAAGRTPLIVDFATSSVAEGKVRLRRSRGELLPEGVLLAADGTPSTRPEHLYEGGTLTAIGGALAGHKGYGLGLAAALLGALCMIDDPDPTPAGTMSVTPPGPPWAGGVFMVVLDPDWFGDGASYAALADGVLGAAASSPPVSGVDRVLVPGEPEALAREVRSREGIPVPEAIRRQLLEVGDRFGVVPAL